MSLWVAMASPLMLSLDLRTITPEVKEILTNEEILAVHKDSLAKMASRVDTSWFSGKIVIRSRFVALSVSLTPKVLFQATTPR